MVQKKKERTAARFIICISPAWSKATSLTLIGECEIPYNDALEAWHLLPQFVRVVAPFGYPNLYEETNRSIST